MNRRLGPRCLTAVKLVGNGRWGYDREASSQPPIANRQPVITKFHRRHCVPFGTPTHPPPAKLTMRRTPTGGVYRGGPTVTTGSGWRRCTIVKELKIASDQARGVPACQQEAVAGGSRVHQSKCNAREELVAGASRGASQ